MLNLKKIELVFEFILWNFRLFTLIPVIFGLFSSVNFFLIGTLEIYVGLKQNFYFTEEVKSKSLAMIVSNIIGGIDYYLIGIILLIFSFGIYELFISKIDFRVNSQEERNVLSITTLEELKQKILQVIIVALIVSLFKKMIVLEIKTVMDVIYIAIAIFLVSLSSYLMHLDTHSHSKPKEDKH